ncbi:MAG TPA: 3-deoxy-manno-octulosonate cytidylyltransferase [bacterium]
MVAVVIPARYNSTRFPGKPLANLLGKPIIQHVYERAKKAKKVGTLFVATDDDRIGRAVSSFGGKTIMTSPDHLSGSDRVAEAAKQMNEEIIINVQGDEPLIEPDLIDDISAELLENDDIPVCTARAPIAELKDLNNPDVVKVVVNRENFALYFSRSPIPGSKREGPEQRLTGGTIYYRHIGIYGYRRSFLLEFSKLRSTMLELHEGLEQLRILEHGYRIKLIDTNYMSVSVDTPEDLEHLRRKLTEDRIED